jgi:uncharacterized phage protein (TIGR01671 family)
MREILFRAWDKNLSTMVRIISLNFRHECGYILANHPDSVKLGRDDTYMLDKADCEIMQFTGLTDANKEKVFEGDILDEGFGSYFIVVWDDDWAKFKLQYVSSKNIQYPEWNRGKKMIIVGNVHQNPELLK